MAKSERSNQQENNKQKDLQKKIMLDRTSRKKKSTVADAEKSDDGEQQQQQQQALQEIQTSSGATQSAKNGLHSSGNVSDETEARPAKRARRERPGGDTTCTDTVADTSHFRASKNPTNDNKVAPSTSTSTRRSSRIRQDYSSSSAAAAAPPSEPRKLRSRTVPANNQVAKKPPPASAGGTTMKLRKRPEVSNSAKVVAQSASGSNNNAYQSHRRSIDVGECEVCIHPYALSYLSKHRKKVHGLAHTTFGCPYCLTTFTSIEDRLDHIQQQHAGKPATWSSKPEGTCLDNVKVHMYACPLCPAHFTHSGLACHLGSAHHTSIDAFSGEIYCKCPFCMSDGNNGKQQGRFKSEDDLRDHIAKKHKGCILLDDIKQPADRVFTRPGDAIVSKPVAARRPKRAPPPQEQESSSDEDEDDMEESSDEDEHWDRLDHNGLIKDYLYGDYIAVDFGMGSLPTAIKAVEDQLETLENSKSIADDDYIAEMKLYAKGLKDRKQKADAERIEKERHREEVERKLLQLEYENRNKSKKRSAEEIEYDKFIERPVSFAQATRESVRKTGCPFGDDCELCVSSDQEPQTDSSGQLIDAPSCHTNVVGDSLKAAESPGDDDSKQGSGRSRRGRRADPTTRSYLMLKEMKHSLRFVSEYNEGYFEHN